MGHGHGDPYKVPDPSIYKVEDVPELVKIKEALGRQGLKDPWLRNEVWRYDVKQWSSHATKLRVFLSRGLVAGLALTAITVGAEMALGGDDHHGHGDGGHH